jgi:hypothetical protein
MPGKLTHKRGTPKPLCLTCQTNRVRAYVNRYCSPQCVPHTVRQSNGRRSAEVRRLTWRFGKYRKDFERMTQGKRQLTKEAIIDAFAEIERRGYHMGYTAAMRAVGRWPNKKKAA